MSLFFNSEKKIKKDQILRDIAIVNNDLINITNIIVENAENAENRLNHTSIKSILPIISNVLDIAERITTTLRGMSYSDYKDFMVPWVDGSYIGIMTWLSAYKTNIDMLLDNIHKVVD